MSEQQTSTENSKLYCWYAPHPNEGTGSSAIFLVTVSGRKIPALCTTATDKQERPNGARSLFIGVAQNGTSDLLAMSDGTLTRAGLSYCDTWGVQKDAESLKKWALHEGHIHGLTYRLPNETPALQPAR